MLSRKERVVTAKASDDVPACRFFNIITSLTVERLVASSSWISSDRAGSFSLLMILLLCEIHFIRFDSSSVCSSTQHKQNSETNYYYYSLSLSLSLALCLSLTSALFYLII
jgi:hypothetical protein